MGGKVHEREISLAFWSLSVCKTIIYFFEGNRKRISHLRHYLTKWDAQPWHSQPRYAPGIRGHPFTGRRLLQALRARHCPLAHFRLPRHHFRLQRCRCQNLRRCGAHRVSLGLLARRRSQRHRRAVGSKCCLDTSAHDFHWRFQ